MKKKMILMKLKQWENHGQYVRKQTKELEINIYYILLGQQGIEIYP